MLVQPFRPNATHFKSFSVYINKYKSQDLTDASTTDIFTVTLEYAGDQVAWANEADCN